MVDRRDIYQYEMFTRLGISHNYRSNTLSERIALQNNRISKSLLINLQCIINIFISEKTRKTS